MYPTPASEEPPTKVSSETFTIEFSISISKIWSLTGTTSLELGETVISTLLEAEPLILEIEAISKELRVICPVA